MKMKPMGDLILLKLDEQKESTKSGIILMDGSATDYMVGEVIAVGAGLFTQTGNRIPMTTAPGDSVLIHKTKAGDGKKIKLEDKEYHLVHESELSMVSSK
jgi:chaperonin GroES